MYQNVIRDPGGLEIVRVLAPEVVVNGSILIVPADTVAFFICNGQISQPYTSGRWEINTRVEPFFVRFRNLMTAGDPGITCQVFYVNICRENQKQGGTGNMIFREKRFNISMNARASYTIRYVISNPRTFLSCLVGMHNNAFSEEDIQPAIASMLLPCIKETIITYISNNTVHSLQNNLSAIGFNIQENLRNILIEYGLNLRAVSITAINVPEEDLRRLNELETRYAQGMINTDLEVDNINRVYGNVENRTLTEVVTGSVRGPANKAARSHEGAAGVAGFMAALPIQMAVANQVMNQFATPINNMLDRSRNGAAASETNRPAPPDLPRKPKTCPNCNKRVDLDDVFCRYCGHQF